jgi:predicted dienelactone hydrolase
MSRSAPAVSRSSSHLGVWIAKGIALATAVVVLGIGVLLTLLHHEHQTELILPAPTGHFKVARTANTWVNEAKTDELAPSPGTKRQLLVWIWYPSAGSQAEEPAEYMPVHWRQALAQSSGPRSLPAVLMSNFLTRDYALVRTNSSLDSPISSEQPTYPIVIMRPGGGALTTEYTVLAEDLASHGYVVVGFDAPYRTGAVVFPDGRVLRRPPQYNFETFNEQDAARLAERLIVIWSEDTSFVIDQLGRLNSEDPAGRCTGHLDLNRVGMFGHSFGGATALQFCHDDSRCKAGIDIDGQLFGSVVREGTTQPFLFLLSSPEDFKVAEADREIFDRIRSVYDRLPNGRYLLAMRGTNHFSFGDQSLLKSPYLMHLLQHIEVRRGLEITSAYVHTFFDVYLKDAPASALDNLRRTYPEVQSVAQ